MKKNIIYDILIFTVCILIPQIAGFIGSQLTRPSVPTWYAGLIKPSFNPPDWLFGPVWITLYAMMGIALFLVWKGGLHKKEVIIGIVFFAVQLILNVCWSYLFFHQQNTLAAFVEIIILWLFIACTMIAFFRISIGAGVLFIPYLAWVSFAAALNFFLWRLNI